MIFLKCEAWLLPTGIFDHAKHINDFMSAGIECYTSQETINHLKLKNHRLNIISNQIQFSVGDFKIIPFDVPHNLPCMGFLISHVESGKIVFITDAAWVPVKFKGISHYCIEANYSDEIMISDRAVGHHMSLATVIQFLKSNDLTHVRNIVLLHLSASGSNAKEFTKEVQILAPNADIFVADKGVEVNMNKLPF